LIGCQRVSRFHIDALFVAELFQRDYSLATTSLNGHRTASLISEKIFERNQQIRTQPPFFLANPIQTFALQQQREKGLSEIFRLFWFDALPPHETINWSPVCAAKFFECLLCCGRWALRREHNAPMSCCKCRRPVLCAWGDPIPRGLILINRHACNLSKKSR
jgi:hypothetical protein